LPQPAGQLGVRAAPELLELLVRLQEGFLDHVGGIELPLQARVQMQTGQQPQVRAEALQVPCLAGGFVAHLIPYFTRCDRRRNLSRQAKIFSTLANWKSVPEV